MTFATLTLRCTCSCRLLTFQLALSNIKVTNIILYSLLTKKVVWKTTSPYHSLQTVSDTKTCSNTPIVKNHARWAGLKCQDFLFIIRTCHIGPGQPLKSRHISVQDTFTSQKRPIANQYPIFKKALSEWCSSSMPTHLFLCQFYLLLNLLLQLARTLAIYIQKLFG